MARLGDSINPALMVGDYSGHVNAASIRAAGLLNFGNAVGGALKDYASEQKEAKNAVKASAAQIKAASTLFPNLKATLEPLGQELANEDMPISERAALAASIPSVLNMGIARETGNEDMAMRMQGMQLQERQFGLQEAESGLRQQATGMEIASAVQAQELDDTTKATLGPSLLEQTLAIAPKGMADDIRKNMADLSPAEQYTTANAIRSLLPKADQAKAPTTLDVAVPGGKMQTQWDPNTRSWVPVQTNGIYTPDGATDAELQGMLPEIVLPGGVVDTGVGVDGQAGVLPPRVGFIPTTPKSELESLQVQKLKQEQAAAEKKAGEAVAASQTMLSQLEQLERHPGFNGLFGIGLGNSMVPGTSAKDASVLFDQLKAKGFLEAVKGMQGMGALSDAEGKKLDVAYLGLQTSMSEKAAKERIKEIKEVIQSGLQRVAGSQVAPEELTPAEKGAKILQGLPIR